MTTNRTPKPEGPAQEPIGSTVCPDCGGRIPRVDGCHTCKGWGWIQSDAPVPATPAPSQPAARELDQLITDIENAICYPPPHPDVSAEWSKRLKPLLEAWTAAKDAEIVWLRKERHRHVEALEAAERERDSLREANARLAADLDAALKAGKDGQK